MKRLLKTGNRILLIFCLSLAAQTAAARTYKAEVTAVRAAAFYRIALSPHVSAIAGAEAPGLRLYDHQGREQPYLIGTFPAAEAARAGVPGSRVPLPAACFSQTDSGDKRSYLRIRLDEAFFIDRLTLRFRGPRYYSRILSLPEALPGWQQRIRQNQEVAIDAAIRARELLLVVQNDDNPPLRLEAVRAEQRALFLTAWLEPGRYSLCYSDSAAIPPRYDITVLADSLRRQRLTILEAGTPELVEPGRHVAARQHRQFSDVDPGTAREHKVLTWAIIAAILLALLFATGALARRIGSRNDSA